MPIKPEEIATLIELFQTSDWDELHVEIDGLQLFVSTDPNARLGGSPAPAPIPAAAPAGAPSAAIPATAEPPPTAPEAAPGHWVAVTAPNLGTFYRAPKPGAAPFVELGQAVDEDTDLCLLEVMKLFTVVKAGMKGTLRQVCVRDAEMVEFGQPLLYIEPA